jgi:hypothetical protein
MAVVKRLEVPRLYKGFAMVMKGIYIILPLFGLYVLLGLGSQYYRTTK